MRVIAGRAKGRKLKFPRLSREREVRPLSDRVRAALFNILGEKAVDSYFLDLFAGTGAVGIEALSRGAKIALFVERDRRVAETIRENLKNTGMEEAAEIYALEARTAIKLLSSKGAAFDLIFLGPPYDSPILEKTLNQLAESGLLKEDGIIIAEHRNKQTLAEHFGKLAKFRDARYGDTVLSFYRTAST